MTRRIARLIPGPSGRAAAILALTALMLLPASKAHAVCGDVTGEGDITVTDALAVLKTAVSISVTLTCDTDQVGVCGDVTGEGDITVTDALAILKTAVSISVTLNCSGTTTTTTGSGTSTTTLTSGAKPPCSSAEVFVQLEGSDLDAGYTGLGHDGDLIEGASITVRIKKRCSDTNAVCMLDSECTAGTCDLTCDCDDPSNATCEATGPTHQASCVTSLSDCTADTDCPAGETCERFYGAPLPLSSAGVPVCVTTYFAEDITGTANAQTGTGSVSATLRSKVHLGIQNDQPCPRCGLPASCGDSTYVTQTTCETAGQTWTAGASMDQTFTCEGGTNDGAACTVHATSEQFGGISRDCPPGSNTNVSGSGLVIAMRELSTSTVSKAAALGCQAPWDGFDGYCSDYGITGDATSCTTHSDCSRCADSGGDLELTSTSMPVACSSNTDCSSGYTCKTYPNVKVSCGWQCHCGFCEDADVQDTSYPCFDDADCTGMSSSATCAAGATSATWQKAANDCGAGFCGLEDTEKCHDADQSECTTQKWISCTSNSDCPGEDTCLTVQKPCFEPVITRTGVASALGKYCTDDPAVGSCTTNSDCGVGSCVDDASEPVSAGLFCIPATASDAVNIAAGTTGPGAIQFATVLLVCRCGDGDIGCDEGCDDSNTTNGDGCDENCDVESGYTCTGEPSTCQ